MKLVYAFALLLLISPSFQDPSKQYLLTADGKLSATLVGQIFKPGADGKPIEVNKDEELYISNSDRHLKQALIDKDGNPVVLVDKDGHLKVAWDNGKVLAPIQNGKPLPIAVGDRLLISKDILNEIKPEAPIVGESSQQAGGAQKAQVAQQQPAAATDAMAQPHPVGPTQQQAPVLNEPPVQPHPEGQWHPQVPPYYQTNHPYPGTGTIEHQVLVNPAELEKMSVLSKVGAGAGVIGAAAAIAGLGVAIDSNVRSRDAQDTSNEALKRAKLANAPPVAEPFPPIGSQNPSAPIPLPPPGFTNPNAPPVAPAPVQPGNTVNAFF